MEQSKFYQIKNVTEHEYTLVGCDGSVITRPIQDIDKSVSAFTIQDAKPGDVFAFDDETIVIFKDLYNSTTFHSYCHIEEGTFSVSQDDMPDWWEGKGFQPATKEQRDLLFQKIKEAGYEWDANKKELKEIKQLTTFEEAVKDLMNDYRDAIGDNDATTEEVKKHSEYLLSLIPQKPAWSKEDEDMCYKAIAVINRLCAEGKDYVWSIKTLEKLFYWLKSLKERVQLQPKQEWSEEDKEVINLLLELIYEQDKMSPRIPSNEKRKMMLSWLKSLRPQNTWKPSDRQMASITCAVRKMKESACYDSELVSLLNDLEKLKRE